MYFQRIWISYQIRSNFLSCSTVKKQTNYFCKWYFNTKPELHPVFLGFFALIICISHLKLKNDLALQVSLPDGQV